MNIKKHFTPFMILVLLSACAVRNEQTQAPSINNDDNVRLTPAVATSVIQPSTDVPITNTPVSLPTETSLTTDTPTPPTWVEVDHWTPANQIRTMFIDRSGDLWTGGPAGIVHWKLDTGKPTIYTIREGPENTNVIGLSQTSDGTIWAGTFGHGLARFDGANWQAFTLKDGLPGNYIVSQTITSQGDLWFTTQKDQHRGDKDWVESSHFVRFNGTNWITDEGIAFDHLVALPNDSIVAVYNEPPRGAQFYSQVGIFDGQSWNDMGVYPGEWVDAMTVAPDGVLWFATRDSVYRYENQIWKEITPPWAGQDFPWVSSIAISADGVAWFGFSGRAAFDIDPCGDRSDSYVERGVYRYDGKTWTHFTTEDGLVDNKICSITLDSSGNAWFGSFDNGVSHFDGHDWKTDVIP